MKIDPSDVPARIRVAFLANLELGPGETFRPDVAPDATNLLPVLDPEFIERSDVPVDRWDGEKSTLSTVVPVYRGYDDCPYLCAEILPGLFYVDADYLWEDAIRNVVRLAGLNPADPKEWANREELEMLSRACVSIPA